MQNKQELLPMNRLVWRPTVNVISRSAFIKDGLLEAIDQLGIDEQAATPGTPICELTGRVLAGEGVYGGTTDDIAEFAGRQCYRSWTKGRPQDEYIANVIGEGHGSIFAHSDMQFLITGVSRSFTHELVRHAIGTATSQESQRYVDAKEMNFVVPPVIANNVANMTELEAEEDRELTIFRRACAQDLVNYSELQEAINDRLKRELAEASNEKQATSAKKRANEAARAVMPNGAETRLVFTMSTRAMWYIFLLRGTEYADLEIRRWAAEAIKQARPHAPHLLKHIEEIEGADGLPALISAFGGRI